MALEVLSNSSYQGNANKIRIPETKNNSATQETGRVNMNVSETPAANYSDNLQTSGDQQNGKKDVSEQAIKNAITKANNKMKNHRTKCEFSYHEETNRVSIKVMDKDTEEVIREIPPEETLEMIEKMWELAGLLVDERR